MPNRREFVVGAGAAAAAVFTGAVQAFSTSLRIQTEAGEVLVPWNGTAEFGAWFDRVGIQGYVIGGVGYPEPQSEPHHVAGIEQVIEGCEDLKSLDRIPSTGVPQTAAEIGKLSENLVRMNNGLEVNRDGYCLPMIVGQLDGWLIPDSDGMLPLRHRYRRFKTALQKVTYGFDEIV